MLVSTLSDVRAEMARHRITQAQLAAALGLTQSQLSRMFSSEALADLTPSGAARMRAALESLTREAVAS